MCVRLRVSDAHFWTAQHPKEASILSIESVSHRKKCPKAGSHKFWARTRARDDVSLLVLTLASSSKAVCVCMCVSNFDKRV